MKKTAIFYGSTTGNTQAVAESINRYLDNQAAILNVENATVEDLEAYECLFLGTSTWGLGDLQDDWEGFISDLKAANLQGKKVALFGFGDAESYGDTFVDGMGAIYHAIADKGCEVIGKVSVENYLFEASTAVIEAQFVGLPLDEDNESDQTQERISAWLKSMRSHLD